MIEDEEIDYPVEKILRRRLFGTKVKYLIKWEGYSNDENCWVNEEDLHCDELLDDFRAHCIIGMCNTVQYLYRFIYI